MISSLRQQEIESTDVAGFAGALRPIFPWSDRYLTGLEVVDEQHQRLVSLINQLGELHSNNVEVIEVLRVLDELAAYTVYHFSTEETLMAEFQLDLPHVDEHQQKHREFIAQVAQARHSVQDNPQGALERLLPFLSKWLIFHILGVDRRMVAELQALRAGATPEQAQAQAEAVMDDVAMVLLESMTSLYEDLVARKHESADINRHLQHEIAERAKAEQALHKNLREVSCLYLVSGVLENRGTSVENVLQIFVDTLAREWPWGSGIEVRLSCLRGQFANTGAAAFSHSDPDGEAASDEHCLSYSLFVENESYGRLTLACAESSVECVECGDDGGRRVFQKLGKHLSDYLERTLAQETRKKLWLAVEQSPASILMTDGNARIEYANPKFCELTGYRNEDLRGNLPSILKSGLTPSETYEELWRTVLSGKSWYGELQNKKKSGEVYWEAMSITPVLNAQGVITNFLAIKEDVTESRRAAEALVQSKQQLEQSNAELKAIAREMQVLSQMSEFIQTCVDEQEVRDVIKQACLDLFPRGGGSLALRIQAGEMFEEVLAWGESVQASSLFFAQDCWGLRRGRSHESVNHGTGLHCRHIHVDTTRSVACFPLMVAGEIMGVFSWMAPIACDGHKGRGLRLAETVAESIKLSYSNFRLREELRIQALRDKLTGLYNRRFFDENLQREMLRVRQRRAELVLVMFDVDHFKRFNDTYGHDAGDDVLRQVAQVLAQGVRQTDLVCRFGGEEMAAILLNTDLASGMERAEVLCQRVRAIQLTYRGEALPRITVSAGVAAAPLHTTAPDELLRLADEALYLAKSGGRDRACCVQSQATLP